MSRRKSGLSLVSFSVVLLCALAWGAAAQKTTVTILSDIRPAYIEWAEQLKERFEAENPDIEIEFIPMQGDPLERMQVLLAAGVPSTSAGVTRCTSQRWRAWAYWRTLPLTSLRRPITTRSILQA